MISGSQQSPSFSVHRSVVLMAVENGILVTISDAHNGATHMVFQNKVEQLAEMIRSVLHSLGIQKEYQNEIFQKAQSLVPLQESVDRQVLSILDRLPIDTVENPKESA